MALALAELGPPHMGGSGQLSKRTLRSGASPADRQKQGCGEERGQRRPLQGWEGIF